MRVGITGSRTITNIDISKYIPDGITELITGGAKGVDTLAECYADNAGIPKLILKPEYNKFGKNAPLKRNELIVQASDVIIAIWDNHSRGTKNTIDYANKIGKRVIVYKIK